MDTINKQIEWSSRLESFFKDMGEKSFAYSYLHKKSEAVFTKRAMRIDLPVIVLSTIAGTLSIGSGSVFPPEYEHIGSACIGSLSLFVGVLNTVGTYFEFNKRAENHRLSHIQYSKLYRFLDVELSLPRHERMSPKDLLKLATDQYERLQEIAPLIPNHIIKNFNKKFKTYTNIAKPSEVNGLESISIYVPEKIEREQEEKKSDSLVRSDTIDDFLHEETVMEKRLNKMV
jgi:hypothetical protein